MTTKQKSAGYFDSMRNEPMYEGDVYYREGYIEPFYTIMKSDDKGFVVNHVNTREYYPLSSMGATLVNSQYIGNILDNPNIIEEFKGIPDSLKPYAEPETETPSESNITATIVDAEGNVIETQDLKVSAGESDTIGQEEEKAENTTVSEDAELDTVGQNAPENELSTPAAAPEDSTTENRVQNYINKLDEQINKECEQKAQIDEQKDANCEQNEDKNEQVSANNSANATDETNPDSIQEDGNGTNNAENADETTECVAEATPANAAEDISGKNIVVEKAAAPVPEVIANTKEEKNAIERRNFCKKQIEKNNEDIAKLQEKADFHNELAKTLTCPPFIKLEKIILENLHKDVDLKGIKDIKDGTKVLENIVAIQEVLKEHSLQAANAENHISDLEDENSKFEDELAELELKIEAFAKQTKLPLDVKEEANNTTEEKEPAEV